MIIAMVFQSKVSISRRDDYISPKQLWYPLLWDLLGDIITRAILMGFLVGKGHNFECLQVPFNKLNQFYLNPDNSAP